MLETIRQFYDQAAEAANECADLAEQTANDAVNSASALATQAYDAVAAEAESLLTQAKQAIPSLPIEELVSTFISTADSLDKTGHAFVTSVKSTASSLWKADLTSTLTDTLSSLSSTIKPYVPEFLQPYLADDASESQVAATAESSEAWYSPIVSLARSVQAYVMGDESESVPAVASVFQSAEAVYVDDAPVATEKVVAEPKPKVKTSLDQTSVDFSQPFSEFASPVSAFSDDSLLSLSSSVVDTYTSDADFVSVPAPYVSMASTPETTLVADVSLEAVSVAPESVSAEDTGATSASTPVVVAAPQDQSVTVVASADSDVVTASHGASYLNSGESSFVSYDSPVFFGAQWINSVSSTTASVLSSAGAALLGDNQNPVAFNQTENANLVFGTNLSFGGSASVAEQAAILTQGEVVSADVKFAVGASALPVAEATLFSAYASVAQAAAASLKNSSEILHAQQASRSGVSSVLPSPFPMVFVNGLVTTLGSNKEQALAVAALNRPLVAVEAQSQMSGGSDSDQRGRQSETESLAFDEAAPIANAASVQKSVASAGEAWDTPFIPQSRDVFVGA
jgi:hypothetical protein